MEANIIYIPLLMSVVGLAYMLVRASWVRKQNAGSERMVEISTIR
jgi:K(+)-stimulated pyrophosphate-energized sodium pump